MSSVLGGRKLSADSVYNRSKPTKSVIHISKDDESLIDDSYKFFNIHVLSWNNFINSSIRNLTLNNVLVHLTIFLNPINIS